MKSYKLSPKAMVLVAGSSKGAQNKYYKEDKWFKLNEKGYEGLSEALVSKVIECLNIPEFVKYEQCLIDNKEGCVSDNMIKNGETLISFNRLYQILFGTDLSDRIRLIDEPSERIDFVCNLIKEETGIEADKTYDYLGKLCSLDCLTLNPDRHFNNI